jgi:sugar phosphate isomerase/epimerase
MISDPRIGGMTFIYPGRSLDEAMRTATSFGFRVVDVGVGGRNGHIDPVQAATEPQRHAATVRKTAEKHGMALNECFTLNFGPPINDPDPNTRAETRHRFEGLAAFARAADFRSILLIPGPIHPQLGQPRSLDLAVEALKSLVEIAQKHELKLRIEADCDSCARTPESAEQLCERVPGLELSLDYSHFIFLGHSQAEVERLHRYAGHVHVRQASPGRIVEFVEKPFIDYAKIIHDLEQRGYDGLFMVEYLSCWETDNCGIDVAIETPKMIAVLEQMLVNVPANEPSASR